VSEGVDAERLQASGFTATRPIASNATATGQAANRRVEVLVLRREGSPSDSPAATLGAEVLSSRRRLLFVVPMVLVVVLGVGWFFLIQGSASEPSEAELMQEPGPVYEMSEPFVVNLRDQEVHYAKIGVALRVSKASAGEVPERPEGADQQPPIENDAQIRDIAITEIQRRSSSQLKTDDGRANLKSQIMKRVNGETELHVVDIYWTEFAVQ
jgi:flagellar basal body-associated protein FliL